MDEDKLSTYMTYEIAKECFALEFDEYAKAVITNALLDRWNAYGYPHLMRKSGAGENQIAYYVARGWRFENHTPVGKVYEILAAYYSFQKEPPTFEEELSDIEDELNDAISSFDGSKLLKQSVVIHKDKDIPNTYLILLKADIEEIRDIRDYIAETMRQRVSKEELSLL
jgi:hypothetical protein